MADFIYVIGMIWSWGGSFLDFVAHAATYLAGTSGEIAAFVKNIGGWIGLAGMIGPVGLMNPLIF